MNSCESGKYISSEPPIEEEIQESVHETSDKVSLSSLPPLSQPSLKRSIAPEPPIPPPHGNISYRPITPNSEVLGSLLDDINNDLEKYKTSNLGLYTGINCTDSVANELQHTISFYRKQGRNRRTDVPVTEIGNIFLHL